MEGRNVETQRIRKKLKNEEDDKWDCSVCTYLNSSESFRCEICHTRKGTATRKPRLNTQVFEQQQLIAQVLLKEKDDDHHKKKREIKAFERPTAFPIIPPRLKNVDRSSPLVFKVFANGYSVIITEFRPKVPKKQASSIPDSPALSNCSSSYHGLTSTPLDTASDHLSVGEAVSTRHPDEDADEDCPDDLSERKTSFCEAIPVNNGIVTSSGGNVQLHTQCSQQQSTPEEIKLQHSIVQQLNHSNRQVEELPKPVVSIQSDFKCSSLNGDYVIKYEDTRNGTSAASSVNSDTPKVKKLMVDRPHRSKPNVDVMLAAYKPEQSTSDRPELNPTDGRLSTNCTIHGANQAPGLLSRLRLSTRSGVIESSLSETTNKAINEDDGTGSRKSNDTTTVGNWASGFVAGVGRKPGASKRRADHITVGRAVNDRSEQRQLDRCHPASPYQAGDIGCLTPPDKRLRRNSSQRGRRRRRSPCDVAPVATAGGQRLPGRAVDEVNPELRSLPIRHARSQATAATTTALLASTRGGRHSARSIDRQVTLQGSQSIASSRLPSRSEPADSASPDVDGKLAGAKSCRPTGRVRAAWRRRRAVVPAVPPMPTSDKRWPRQADNAHHNQEARERGNDSGDGGLLPGQPTQRKRCRLTSDVGAAGPSDSPILLRLGVSTCLTPAGTNGVVDIAVCQSPLIHCSSGPSSISTPIGPIGQQPDPVLHDPCRLSPPVAHPAATSGSVDTDKCVATDSCNIACPDGRDQPDGVAKAVRQGADDPEVCQSRPSGSVGDGDEADSTLPPAPARLCQSASAADGLFADIGAGPGGGGAAGSSGSNLGSKNTSAMTDSSGATALEIVPFC